MLMLRMSCGYWPFALDVEWPRTIVCGPRKSIQIAQDILLSFVLKYTVQAVITPYKVV